MACGEKFSHLVPKPVGLGDMLGWSAYAERKAAADRVHGYVQESWAILKAKGGVASIEGLSSYLAAYQELPGSTWFTATPDEQLVAMAQANAEDGTCMLEKLEAATGSSPVPSSGTSGGKSIIDQATSWLFLAGAAYALYWFSQRSGGTNKAVGS